MTDVGLPYACVTITQNALEQYECNENNEQFFFPGFSGNNNIGNVFCLNMNEARGRRK